MVFESQLQSYLIVLLSPLLLSAMTIPQADTKVSCSRSSPTLNNCVKEGLVKVIKRFQGGDEKLGVLPLEPLTVPYLQVNHEDTNLSLELTLKHVLIAGITDMKLVKVTANLDDINKLEVISKIPELYIAGEYISEGLIVNFPLHSAGAFSINMTEVTSSWVVYFKEITRNQTKYLEIDGFDIDMMPVSISCKPAKQLDGDNNLGEAVNEILNENSSEMYSLMKGKFAEVLSGVLTELANAVLKETPEATYLRP